MVAIGTLAAMEGTAVAAGDSHPLCRVRAIPFDGWNAHEISNEWTRLIIVPQLGGRLMQVSFNRHDFLFINPKYRGKYISPMEAAGRWVNYGGDKIWPMPEGTNDEGHWVLKSDLLDDGNYGLEVLSEGAKCSVRLDGPPDPATGLQFSREISLGKDSPQVSFLTTMRNISGHAIEWAMQTVSQYDVSDPSAAGSFNPDFWAFTPTNPNSAYFEGYQVRDGLANDPSLAVKNHVFRLHWLYLQNEVWLDSTDGWLAVVDDSNQYAMVERFQYQTGATYPGKASVIFYKNGATLEVDERLKPRLSSSSEDETPFYMEAEINSPIVRLQPGEKFEISTSWFPTRADKTLQWVVDAGVVVAPLVTARSAKGVVISGRFGVFWPGTLQAHLFDGRGIEIGKLPLQAVKPEEMAVVKDEISPPSETVRISLHLMDEGGADRGSLGEVVVAPLSGGQQ